MLSGSRTAIGTKAPANYSPGLIFARLFVFVFKEAGDDGFAGVGDDVGAEGGEELFVVLEGAYFFKVGAGAGFAGGLFDEPGGDDGFGAGGGDVEFAEEVVGVAGVGVAAPDL